MHLTKLEKIKRSLGIKYTGVIVVSFLLMTIVGYQHQTQADSDIEKLHQIETMYDRYTQDFPDVKSISVEQLQQLQQQEKIVLVDVRTPQERSVSIIPGAISAPEFEQHLAQYRDRTIVAYCTIGYRSGKYIQQLQQPNLKIFNLRGSLLAWTHAQGELISESGETKKLHVFGRQWKLTADNYQAVISKITSDQ